MSRLGALPAVLCIVAAAVLGGVGWSARQESRERALVEALDEGPSEDASFFGSPSDGAPEIVDIICGLLIDAALLQAPIDPSMGFDPSSGPVTTLAPSDIDTAFTLLSTLEGDLIGGIPELDHPDLREAIAELHRALRVAVTETDEPLATPEVVAAAADLRVALDGRCL